MEDRHFEGRTIHVVRYPDLELRPHEVPSFPHLVVVSCVNPQLRLVTPDHKHLHDR
jgi:hypothetical protein